MTQWNLSIVSPMGNQSGVLTVNRAAGKFTGAFVDSTGTYPVIDGTAEETDEGLVLEWRLDLTLPHERWLTCRAVVQGNSLKGRANNAPFGAYPLVGTLK